MHRLSVSIELLRQGSQKFCLIKICVFLYLEASAANPCQAALASGSLRHVDTEGCAGTKQPTGHGRIDGDVLQGVELVNPEGDSALGWFNSLDNAAQDMRCVNIANGKWVNAHQGSLVPLCDDA